MLIIGCDYHPSWQQICWLDTGGWGTLSTRSQHLSYFSPRCQRVPQPFAGLAKGASFDDWEERNRPYPPYPRMPFFHSRSKMERAIRS